MSVERMIRVLAGSVVTLSLALGVAQSPLFVSSWFLALTAFAGLNLLQSGVTGFCLPEIVLRKLGAQPGSGCSR